MEPEERPVRNLCELSFLFWLLGAIDGHAKNFSIFLHQGGRFELTPVYDVISAYPLAEKRQIEYRNLKMAMALRGKMYIMRGTRSCLDIGSVIRQKSISPRHKCNRL